MNNELRVLLALTGAGALVLLAGCGGGVHAAQPESAARPAAAMDAGEVSRTAERIVAIVDYVASDYGPTVKDGVVIDAAEYDEQLRMVETIRAFAGELPKLPLALVHDLDAAVKAKAPGARVASLCAALRERTIGSYAIVTAPSLPPDLRRGEELFRANCIECHGAGGRGDGPRAASLDPKPIDLHDAERMAPVTPYRVYCDLTYGIAGTAMGALPVPAADRWSVAFYAVALRHLGARAAPSGETATALATIGGRERPRLGLATLAASTDEELAALLAPSVADASARQSEVARLRAVTSFDASQGDAPAALARRLIGAARAAFAKGDLGEADRLVVDAYLRGIEELEAPLRTKDAALVVALEEGTARLRAAIVRGPSAADLVDARTAELEALLDRAQRAIEGSPMGNAVLALAAALLVLREGIEVALIVAAVLALVRRAGMPPSAARAIHGGWLSALVAGLVTFALARTVITSLSLQREAVEAIVSLLAAAVLFATSFWLLSKADARRWMAYVKAQAQGSANAGGVAGLFGVAFLAAYREAFETVLFFEALLGGASSRALPLALGALAGGVLLAGAVYAIGKLERRLPVTAFFGVSGALLSGLAIVLLGQGVHALEAAGLLVPRSLGTLRLEWLGIYPDALSLGAQALLLAAIIVASVFARRGLTAEPARPAS